MRFSLAILATFALSAFTSATPVVVRNANVEGAVGFLTSLKTEVTPLAAQLASIRSNNATAEVVKPIMAKLATAITTANTAAEALKGQPTKVVLGSDSSNEIFPLETVNKLVQDILTLLVPTLAGLYKILGPNGDLTPIIPPVGADLSNLVGSLLVGVAGLIIQLKPTVASILGAVSGLVSSLGLGGLVVALGL